MGTHDVQLDCLSSSSPLVAGGFGFLLIPRPKPKPSADLSAETGVLMVTTGGGRGRAFMRYRVSESRIGIEVCNGPSRVIKPAIDPSFTFSRRVLIASVACWKRLVGGAGYPPNQVGSSDPGSVGDR